MEKLLTIERLNVDFAMRAGTLRAVNDVSLSIDKGERLGLVGSPEPASLFWASR